MSLDKTPMCNECNMTFKSAAQLGRHRTKFCVGGKLGDPNQLLSRHGLGSADNSAKEGYEPSWADEQKRPQSENDSLARISELERLKDKKLHMRKLHELEEKTLLDTDRHGQVLVTSGHSTNSLRNEHSELRELQYEYNKLLEKERELRLGLASTEFAGPYLEQPRSGSQSDNPMHRDKRWRDSHQQHMKMLADNHNKQVSGIKSKNKDLEKQREDIKKKLQELNSGRSPNSGSRSPTAQALKELKEQEEKNHHALQDLKKELDKISQESKKPASNGNSILAEIGAMRQSYIQNGGNDPAVLAQIADMEAEAMGLPQKRHRDKARQNIVDPLALQMQALELDNMRLQRQLDAYRRTLPATHTDDFDQLNRARKEHAKQLADLQHEVELARKKAELEKYKEQLQSSSSPKTTASGPLHAEVPPLRPSIQHTGGSPLRDSDTSLDPAPYDPNAGFVIFYDYVLGLDPWVTSCRLVAGLYNNKSERGEPSVLPFVFSEPAASDTTLQNTNMAFVGSKQPVPRCPASEDMSLVLELQVSSGSSGRMNTTAWCKMYLFDSTCRVLSGRWKLPLRVIPVQPKASSTLLNNVPQYGIAEIYLRIVNYRDYQYQSKWPATAHTKLQYKYPPQEVLKPTVSTPLAIPPPLSVPPPEVSPPPLPPQQRSQQELGDTGTLGFQVERVRYAEHGEGKVRLTVYHKTTGQIAQSSSSAVTCSTTAVRSNFKHLYHVFGQQEAVFQDVSIAPDLVLIARFYLRKRTAYLAEEFVDQPPTESQHMFAEESLVAWAALPLLVSKAPFSRMSVVDRNGLTNLRINCGTHTLQLYVPPVPEPDTVPLEHHYSPKAWQKYGRANLRLHIFYGQPRPGSLTPSEASSDEEDNLQQEAWIPRERIGAPYEPFTSGDGFDLYVDGCRNLPDAVTLSKVSGRVLDRQYEKFGGDINTSIMLDSDIYNPIYNYRQEFREPNMPATATLLLKVYTIDKFSNTMTVAGYCTLNIFVETGTENQPVTDKGGIQMSLNEGAHQLRLYRDGPNGADPMAECILRDSEVRTVPCATCLVRIVKAPVGPQGNVLQAEKVPQRDWVKLGLFEPRPLYADRVYYSMTCVPSRGENQLFHTQVRRADTPVRNTALLMAGEQKANHLKTERGIEVFIKHELSKKLDETPNEFDLTYIAVYSPKHGLKVSLDAAKNLPWSNFTHAHMCLNPPGAFYKGQPNASYDKPLFTSKLELQSTNTAPVWSDGFQHLANRTYHRFLCLIIHLEEVGVTAARENYKYGLLDEAWTCVQVFSDVYAHTEIYQLPLFHGSPSALMLKQLAREPCRQWISRAIRSKTIKLMDGASVYVRLCDGRRDEEIVPSSDINKMVEISTNYLPEKEKSYLVDKPGNALEQLVPQGKTAQQFINNLSTNFKGLVYKLYEKGKIGR